MDVNKYLKQEESQVLERKRSLSDSKDIGHTICAFANTEGGILLLGVDDKGGVPGLEKEKLDPIQKQLADLTKKCKPVPSTRMEVKEISGKYTIVMLVNEVLDTACFYDGKVWIRTGSTNRQLSSSELIDFLKSRRILNFEDEFSDATIDDIDRNKLDGYLRKRSMDESYKKKKTADLLFSLKLMKNNRVTNLAVLFFAKDIMRFTPQAEIKLVRFKGIEPVDIIDAQYTANTLFEAIEQSLSFVLRNTKTRFEIKDIKRKEIPEYPTAVVREAIVNAVGHRDYYNQNSIQISIFDDRIEVTSPGALPKDLTIEQLGRLASHRNARLYQMLSLADYVEGYGTGIPRMIKRMRERELPDPYFEEIGNFFRVTLYNGESRKAIEQYGLNELQQKMLRLIKNKKNKSELIAKECNRSVPTIVKNLAEMEKKGLIKKIGKTRGAYYELTG